VRGRERERGEAKKQDRAYKDLLQWIRSSFQCVDTPPVGGLIACIQARSGATVNAIPD
jgi:hypothetical protein